MSDEDQEARPDGSDSSGGSEPPRSSRQSRNSADRESSPVDDLAQGLGLMFRAARKAVKRLDPERVNDLGQRASAKIDESGERIEDFARRTAEQVESIDTETVKTAGRKVMSGLQPSNIEAFATVAGKEMIGVVERVATRVSDVIGSLEDEAESQDAEAKPSSADTESKSSSPDNESKASDESPEKAAEEKSSAATSASGDESKPSTGDESKPSTDDESSDKGAAPTKRVRIEE